MLTMVCACVEKSNLGELQEALHNEQLANNLMVLTTDDHFLKINGSLEGLNQLQEIKENPECCKRLVSELLLLIQPIIDLQKRLAETIAWLTALNNILATILPYLLYQMTKCIVKWKIANRRGKRLVWIGVTILCFVVSFICDKFSYLNTYWIWASLYTRVLLACAFSVQEGLAIEDGGNNDHIFMLYLLYLPSYFLYIQYM